MLRTAKSVVLRSIRALGGFQLVAASGWRQRRLLILCYHGFSLRDEHLWNPALFVTGDHLERRLRALKEGRCEVLPLGEGIERLRAGTLPPRAVAITVDDGLHDFHAVAYPILCRLRTPVTVYASSYYIIDQRPVFPVMVSYLLWRGGANGVQVDAGTTAAEFVRRASEERWSADDKHACLAELAGAMGEDWEGLLRDRVLGLMSPAEIRALDPDIADIQLHTHRHRTPLDHGSFSRELRENRDALVACGLDRDRLVHFCYPSGVHHPEFLPWLREAGVLSATTCIPGLARADTEPLLLPRFIDTSVTPEVEFEAWSAGIREFFRRPQRQFSG